MVSLEYEAFIPMAEKEMLKICQILREKWKLENIAIHHRYATEIISSTTLQLIWLSIVPRLGIVPVGEASIVLAISSEHRANSLQAVSYGIDELKRSVPIWKKEIYDEGTAEWKSNAECPWTRK